MNKFSSLFILVMILLIFSQFSCNSPTEPGSSSWIQSKGLQGFNITGFGESGGNLVAGTYCALCSQAYIFLSTDEGATWKLDTAFHVYNHFDNGYYTNGLYLGSPVKFFTNNRYIFAGISGIYRGALYRSSDNGITWSDNGITWPEKDSDHTENINCFCALGKNLLVGTDHGVFLSTNNGDTWQSDNVGIPNIYTGHPPPVSSMVATISSLFATTEGFGIYRSVNNGVTWTKVNSMNYDFMGITVINYKIFAAAFNEQSKPLTGGVFVSIDNGESWEHSDAGITDHGVGTIYFSGQYLFAGTNTAIFVSTSEGATWRNISAGSGIDSIATIALSVSNSYLLAGTNSNGAWIFPLDMLGYK